MMLFTNKKPLLYALIVGGDKIASQMISFTLKNVGFDCMTASDGVHATKLMNIKEYDFVVTGLLMPNKNGHTLVSEIVRSESRPVVMVHT